MAICFEKPVSRQASLGSSSSSKREYFIGNAATEQDAFAILVTRVPQTIGNLILDNLDVTEVSAHGGMWDGTASYVTPERKEEEDNETEEEGDWGLSIEITANTTHITQSLETISRSSGSGSSAPDLQGAIGATKDGIDGVDIYTPSLAWSEDHILHTSRITFDYVHILKRMVGTTNDAPFRGFPIGEVLFLGCSCSKRFTGRSVKKTCPVNFKFIQSDNLTDIRIGDIGSANPDLRIDKKGWEYLWVYYEEKLDSSTQRKVKRPEHVYVERVYRKSNFADLGIGTAK